MRTRKMKIDGGSRWRWYAEPAPDRDRLAVATYIELRSVWELPRFEWYTLRVHRQLARTQAGRLLLPQRVPAQAPVTFCRAGLSFI